MHPMDSPGVTATSLYSGTEDVKKKKKKSDMLSLGDDLNGQTL